MAGNSAAGRQARQAPLMLSVMCGRVTDGASAMTTLIIGNLFRDLTKKRYIVTFTGEDDPEKHLGVVLPFDCTFENLKAEAEKAIRALAKELEAATIRST
jgi:hypothetical protein